MWWSIVIWCYWQLGDLENTIGLYPHGRGWLEPDLYPTIDEIDSLALDAGVTSVTYLLSSLARRRCSWQSRFPKKRMISPSRILWVRLYWKPFPERVHCSHDERDRCHARFVVLNISSTMVQFSKPTANKITEQTRMRKRWIGYSKTTNSYKALLRDYRHSIIDLYWVWLEFY